MARRFQAAHSSMRGIGHLGRILVWIAVLVGHGGRIGQHGGSLLFVNSQDCPMQIWVFDSLEDCVNPRDVDQIYVDGQCHSLTREPDFPGTYIAQCTSDGNLQFVESGCADTSCGSCEVDRTAPSSLYARSDNPFLVQQVQESEGGRFECFYFTNGLVKVYFAFYGDCSAPGCSIEGEVNPTPTVPPPPTPPPVDPPTPPPVVAPAPRPTRRPTPPPSPRPTPRPTPKPTSRPTRAPNPEPTTNPPTGSPVQTPVTNQPTWAPVTAPITIPPSAGPTHAPTRSPITADMTMYPSLPPVENQTKTEMVPVEMLLSPINEKLTEADLRQWATITTTRIRWFDNERGVRQVRADNISQQIIAWNSSSTTAGGASTSSASALLITFLLTVEMTADAPSTALAVYLDTFDQNTEKALYRANLQGVVALQPVIVVLAAAARDGDGNNGSGGGGGGTSNPDKPTDENETESSEVSSSPKTVITMVVASVGSVAALSVIALALLMFRWSRRRQGGGKSSSRNKKRQKQSRTEPDDSEPEITLEVEDCHHVDAKKLMFPKEDVQYTHDIELRPGEDDDISTLGGFTGIMTGTVKDDATASVHEDFDFDNNRYRTEENATNYDPSFSHASTMFSSQTALERLGAMLFNDDKSLDQQFLDDRMNNETTGAAPAASAKRTRISPFEVRAPPGLLGMVVDSLPNGGPPIVRAIQPNSVLEGKVRIGDRLLSVNHKDVTGLTAKDVSNLISFKQNEERLLKFVRIE